jgi:cytochrome c oxidase cbb3-type subunit I
VSAHILVSTLFLGVAAILFYLSMAAVSFPDALGGALSYGRVRPAALIAAMLGWLVISLSGGVYYVLPRLTGARLQAVAAARLGLFGTSGLTLLGMVAVMVGLGDGAGPFNLPLWLDVPVLLVLVIPLLVTVLTLRARTESGVYVTLWFVMAGVVWLPMLYLAHMIPAGSVGRALQHATFAAAFPTLWVTAVGVGLAYYTVVRESDQPLANRQLARVGFWSLAFAASWAGPLQLAFGPTPDWLDAVAAALTLALPIAAVANAVAIALTLGPAWRTIGRRPALLATVGGLGMAVAVALATSIAGFGSSAAMVAFTPYWDGVLMAALFGAGGLLVAGWTHQALPAVTGFQLDSPDLALRHVRLTLWGVGGSMGLLMLAGLVAGFTWAGGAYTETVAAGEGWATLPGTADILVGLSLLTGLVALAGQFAFVLSVYRTVTSGRAGPREILVAREAGS